MTPEPPVLSASANDRVSIERLFDGAVRISSGPGYATIAKPDIPALQAMLLDIDQEPRLTFQFNDDTPHRVTETVSIAIGNDGKVVVVSGDSALPCQTVELEVGDVGRVARALS